MISCMFGRSFSTGGGVAGGGGLTGPTVSVRVVAGSVLEGRLGGLAAGGAAATSPGASVVFRASSLTGCAGGSSTWVWGMESCDGGGGGGATGGVTCLGVTGIAAVAGL